MEDHAAAAVAVDRELLQESHTGLHCLGAPEQGSENDGGWMVNATKGDITVCEATGMFHTQAVMIPLRGI